MPDEMKLQYLTKQLHLSAVYQHCHGLAREASEMQITYEQYLISVLEQEVKSREETMKKSRIKQAQFRQIKTLDTYDFTVMPDLNKPKVISLTDSEYIRKKSNVFFIGNTGTGNYRKLLFMERNMRIYICFKPYVLIFLSITPQNRLYVII